MKIGTDIIHIARIEKLIGRYGLTFKQRYLSAEEIGMARRVETFAGLWAAKEAVAKALGCGIGAELSFHDILITKDSKGAPRFTLSPNAQKRFPVTDTSLSISHDGGFAIAVAVVVCKAA